MCGILVSHLWPSGWLRMMACTAASCAALGTSTPSGVTPTCMSSCQVTTGCRSDSKERPQYGQWM